MLEKDSGLPIQAMPLGRGDAASPYIVQQSDTVVEFTADGTVVATLGTGGTTSTTVLAGARYSIGVGVVSFTLVGHLV